MAINAPNAQTRPTMDALLKDGYANNGQTRPTMDVLLKDENAQSDQTLPTVTHILGPHSNNSAYTKTLLKIKISLMDPIVQPAWRFSLKMEALMAANSYNPRQTHLYDN